MVARNCAATVLAFLATTSRCGQAAIAIVYRLYGERGFPLPPLQGHSSSTVVAKLSAPKPTRGTQCEIEKPGGAICNDVIQQFVQESGGATEIKSEVGVGTTVRMMLQPA